MIALLLICLAACQTPGIVATRNLQQGDFYANANDFEKALDAYHRYLQASASLGIYRNPLREAEVHRKIGYIHSVGGRYDSAVRHLQQAYGMDTLQADNLANILQDLNQLAIHHAYRGAYKRALADLETALARYDRAAVKTPVRKAHTDILLSKARILYTQGNYDAAESILRTCLRTYEMLPDAATERIEASLVLANIHSDLGDFATGEQLVRQSIDLCRASGLNFSRQRHTAGNMKLLDGKLEEGLSDHLQGLQQARQSRIVPLLLNSCLQVGDAYSFLGDDEEAREYYRQAQELQQGSKPGFGGSLELRLGSASSAYAYFASRGLQAGAAEAALALGQEYFSRGAYDSARLHYASAAALYQSRGMTSGYLTALLRQGEAALALGALPEAGDYLEAYTRLSRRLGWAYWFLHGQLAMLNGDFAGAETSLRKAVEDIEATRSGLSIEALKRSYQGSKNKVYEYLIDLLMSAEGGGREAFYWNEKARARTFLDLLATKEIEPKSPDDRTLIALERSLRLRVARLSKETTSGVVSEDIFALLTKALQQYDSVKQVLQGRDPAYATVLNVEPYRLEEIQAILRPDEVLVEYWLGEKRSYAWLVAREGATTVSLATDDAEVNALVTAFRNAIRFQVPTTEREVGSRLYELLVRPLEDALARYASWIVIPHRAQTFMPFQALPDAAGNPLVLKTEIAYAPSAAVFAYCRKRRSDHPMSLLSGALGAHAIGEHLPLPGSVRESDEIRKLFGRALTRVGAEATESFVRENAGAFRHVHFATHGKLDQRNPMGSYLLFSADSAHDGRLSASDFFRITLDAEVVTLSACETGLGKLNRGNDLMGLTRAVIYSGAKAVVVSLWQVDDEATTQLIIDFYKNMTGGETPAAAMALAQQKYQRAHPDKRAPYYWAPFIIMGDGR